MIKTVLLLGGVAVAAFLLFRSGLFKAKAAPVAPVQPAATPGAAPLVQPAPPAYPQGYVNTTPPPPYSFQGQPVGAAMYARPLPGVYQPTYALPAQTYQSTYAQPLQPYFSQQAGGSSLVGSARYKIPGHEVWQAR